MCGSLLNGAKVPPAIFFMLGSAEQLIIGTLGIFPIEAAGRKLFLHFLDNKIKFKTR